MNLILCIYLSACPACPSSGRYHISVFWRKLMASLAMSFTCINCSNSIIKECMFGFGNYFKMVRIYTRRVVAYMMNIFSFWYFSIFQFITKTMGRNTFWLSSFTVSSWIMNLETSIAILLDITRPLPTAVKKNLIMFLKIILWWIRYIRRFHIYIIFFKNVIYCTVSTFILCCQSYSRKTIKIFFDDLRFFCFWWPISSIAIYIISFENIKYQSKRTTPFLRYVCRIVSQSIFSAYLELLFFCKFFIHSNSIIAMGTQCVK